MNFMMSCVLTHLSAVVLVVELPSVHEINVFALLDIHVSVVDCLANTRYVTHTFAALCSQNSSFFTTSFFQASRKLSLCQMCWVEKGSRESWLPFGPENLAEFQADNDFKNRSVWDKSGVGGGCGFLWASTFGVDSSCCPF